MQLGFDLLLRIFRQRNRMLLLDDSQHRGSADSGGSLAVYERVEEDAIAGEHIDVCTIVERFAIDERAVAIEDDMEHRDDRGVTEGRSMTLVSTHTRNLARDLARVLDLRDALVAQPSQCDVTPLEAQSECCHYCSQRGLYAQTLPKIATFILTAPTRG